MLYYGTPKPTLQVIRCPPTRLTVATTLELTMTRIENTTSSCGCSGCESDMFINTGSPEQLVFNG